MQLQPGQHVIAQYLLTRHWDQQAVILESQSNGHSYIIRINVKTYLRNRRFLRPKPNPEPNQTNSTRPKVLQETTSTKPPILRETADTTPPMPPETIGKPEEPRKTYPTQECRQRSHYQVTNPKHGKRNRQT